MKGQPGLTSGNGGRWPRLVKGLLAALLTVVFVLMATCVCGPDPRYLMLREGMTKSQVRMLLGTPDYKDLPLDHDDGWAWFYGYPRSEIVVEWEFESDPEGRVSKTIFLHSFW